MPKSDKQRAHLERLVAASAAARRGRPISDRLRAHIERLAATCRGSKRSPETRAEMSAAATGRKHTPETRAKMRALALERNTIRYQETLLPDDIKAIVRDAARQTQYDEPVEESSKTRKARRRIERRALSRVELPFDEREP